MAGSLVCKCNDVKGGELADSIGDGKPACTIGLIEKTKDTHFTFTYVNICVYAFMGHDNTRSGPRRRPLPRS